ncbi:hypothetical protein VTN96DRAFT_8355 [Rasamsonia emersonii]|uniref:Uncharacterized protein n=1 Tax=Rasamsonia emersonii (strain ATCC 16479 / CBS 393.64 / IMI 116815) TaxID=1408163 RepID=A0A0F4YXG0_RASE3|nr:hypothetical protein T310_3031 [Rasamsonia emersonii CBS 393.64]KKA22924.1 hypothetical protein T310_3031 [Rasamsonia emersonii CBS 393.64]
MSLGSSARTSRYRQRLLKAAFVLIPVGSVGYYGVQRWLSSLEARYPPLSPADVTTTTTTVLRTPCNPDTQRCAYIDVYTARVPLRILQQLQQRQAQRRRKDDNNDKDNLHVTWAKAFLGSRVMRAEAPFVGLASTSDDIDRSIKFLAVDEDVYQHGSLAFIKDQNTRTSSGTVDKKDIPDEAKPAEGVLFCWHMPDEPRRFFETIARWGYPWRLMSGGRHELSVSAPFIPDEDDRHQDRNNEPVVEVRFATAHDYEVVPEEGPLEKQKIIPVWTLRLHRAYARFLLDMAVKELIASSEQENR